MESDEIFYSDSTGIMLLNGDGAMADDHFNLLNETSYFSDDFSNGLTDFKTILSSPNFSFDILWGVAIWSVFYNSSAARMSIKAFLTKKIFFTDRWSVFTIDELRLLIRAFKLAWFYPILVVLDFNMLVNFIKKTDEYRLGKDIILSNLKYSTPISLLVKFLYKLKIKDSSLLERFL